MKIFRIIIIVAFVVLVSLAGVIFLALTYEPLFSVCVKQAVRSFSGYQLSNFTVGAVGFNQGPDYLIDQVEAEIVLPDLNQMFKVRVEQLKILNLKNVIRQKASLQIEITQASLYAQDDSYVVEGLSGKFSSSSSSYDLWRGNFNVETCLLQEYRLTSVELDLDIIDHQMQVKSITGKLYGGSMKGSGQFDLENTKKYQLLADLFNVDPKGLQDKQPMLENVRGQFSGQVNFSGAGKTIEAIQGDLVADHGAQVTASLLKPLLHYIPEVQQKNQLNEVIKDNGLVTLEVAEIQLKSLADDKLQTHFKLKSKLYNLDMNITVDLNVEGGLMELLKLDDKF